MKMKSKRTEKNEMKTAKRKTQFEEYNLIKKRTNKIYLTRQLSGKFSVTCHILIIRK